MKLSNTFKRTRHQILESAHFWNSFDYYEEAYSYDTSFWHMRLFWPEMEYASLCHFLRWTDASGPSPGLTTIQKVNGAKTSCYCIDIQAAEK